MAKDLKALIRLHQWFVDEKRRKVAELERMVAELQDRLRKLEAEVVAEQKVARAAPESAGATYGAYARHVIERRERLAQSIASTAAEANHAREELNDAYRELKKYEIAQATRDRRAASEAARRDQAVLDEIGVETYRRRKAG